MSTCPAHYSSCTLGAFQGLDFRLGQRGIQGDFVLGGLQLDSQEGQGQSKGLILRKKEENVSSGLTPAWNCSNTTFIVYLICQSERRTVHVSTCPIFGKLRHSLTVVFLCFSLHFLTEFASYKKSRGHYLGHEYSWQSQPYLLCKRIPSGSLAFLFLFF